MNVRAVALAVSDILLIAGVIWFLQGTSVLPGSFMTGSLTWAVAGVACVIAGVVMQAWVIRPKR